MVQKLFVSNHEVIKGRYTAIVVERSGVEIQRGKMSHSYDIQKNIPLFQEVNEEFPGLLYFPRSHTINPHHKI